MPDNWSCIAQHIATVTTQAVVISKIDAVNGGCINQTWKLQAEDGRAFFVKMNKMDEVDMFAAEAEGLQELAGAAAIRVPLPLCYGQTDQLSYLVMEFIGLSARQDVTLLGEQLAHLHHCHAKQFGWFRDNTIGTTKQHNKQCDDWLDFWRQQRLLYQLNLARQNGYSPIAYRSGLDLSENLSVFFHNYQPKPSLLHGDLWTGNCAVDQQGNPVIYDPAVYYGDREADLAMTELFGHFGQPFFDAYNAHYAIDSGYTVRKILYNLYHVLNHFNLFGGGYADQAHSMVQRLQAEIK